VQQQTSKEIETRTRFPRAPTVNAAAGSAPGATWWFEATMRAGVAKEVSHYAAAVAQAKLGKPDVFGDPLPRNVVRRA
jgi:hypothetical protein